MSEHFTVHIGGRSYTADDIAASKHRGDPAITEPSGNVTSGGAVGIQAGVITGDITFD